ncbi:hypothetical protein BASA50_008971 [Batrachochytrium salamandrivorans]|uniref:Ribonuclease P/MRP protein subunit POP5 n=1 Tax=Batrachochytrium salamandrivorans TaxID=1357716 RepID=A0ABQ8F2G9_9FUNG|nr:hypothetical protein BASA60_010063 [Batrachochytrium salamandrivorans]KAH6565324.1 hypothetical protein BASA62_007386 [Batrachochytrium salamandrivorans]KAH6590971.1 hypothetical protein BASA50_008971 [Batrachochytrium salamandrivorans]KAH9268572.1 hypothetical protein BASA84_000177 [Batrachochytrium salamandrivorans]
MVRFKNRYLLCEIIFEDGNISESLNSYHLLNAIKESLEVNFGSFGMGMIATSLQVKYYSPFTNLAIIRVNRDYVRLLWACITFTTAIRRRTCLIHVVHLSGTIKLVQKQAIKRNKIAISSLKSKHIVDDAKANSLMQGTLTELNALT